jgi:hypothetical protein
MSLLNKIKTKWWIEIVSLASISALSYLTSVGRFSYFRDDWYYAYDSYIAGPSIFKTMFSSDRPARSVFFGIYSLLFGPQPLPYHIGVYIWWLFAAFSALRLFHLLWPGRRITNFSMALLFLLYPGFLWWPAGIEYQPMVASLCLHTFSIVLTLTAIRSPRGVTQILLIAGSILTGLSAIALVDYAIGMEAFRLLCIFLLIHNAQRGFSFGQKVVQTVRASLMPLVIPLSFLFWKIFIFVGDRKATDISVQTSVLIDTPLETVLLWGERLFISALNVSVTAWWTPLRQYASFLRDENPQLTFLIVAISMALTLVAARFMTHATPDFPTQATSNADGFSFNAIWLGLLGMTFGLLPVIMANRFVYFRAYSHYALPASLAAVILIVGVIYYLLPKKLQMILISVLVGIAALTHRAVAINAASEQASIRDFWWQVYWRIPGIQPGTLLAAHYPSISYGEGYGEDIDIVAGPANFLYYRQPQPGIELVRYKLGATLLDDLGIQNILDEKEKKTKEYRSHTMFLNYRRTLIIDQPSTASCVHVIDARWIERSPHDTDQIAQLFPHSKIELLLTENENTLPPLDFAFGSEPFHGWCYYYQRAELARQRGDWETIAALEAKATSLGLMPGDPVEWTPFLQAYAFLGQTEKVQGLAAQFRGDPFYDQQLCENLNGMNKNGYPLQPDMQVIVNDLFCK